MDKIKVGLIGYGQRGVLNLSVIMLDKEIEIAAVCDAYPDRADDAAKAVVDAGRKEPLVFTDYKELLNCSDVNTAIICSSWDSHVAIAIDAIKCGKAVGVEVGGGYSVEECRELVDAWEKNPVPFMMLENCCFGKNELLAQNLARAGKFGEIVYCHGAYAHDLREEITGGKENRHYRLENYKNRNCENYPTHELGPIAKIIDINRGNKMNRLVSVASKSAGLKKYINDRKDTIVNKELLDTEFMQGDIVDTIITCENGETISLRLDTTLPRSYSREFTVRGTAGMYEEQTNSVFLDGDPEYFEQEKFFECHLNNAYTKYGDYLPEYWKTITKEDIENGHGGMDVYSFNIFFSCLKNDLPMPVDVYDAAAWMVITPLSEESIRTGLPVEIPDFTNGKWKDRARCDITDYKYKKSY